MTTTKIEKEWIQRIFKRFDEIFGEKFLNQFTSENDFDLEVLKWQAALMGCTAEEIGKVLNLCKNGYILSPPNFIEFYHYAKGFKQPIKPKPLFLPDMTPGMSKQYIAAIKGKLNGKRDSDTTLATLDQQVLQKMESKNSHWQDS